MPQHILTNPGKKDCQIFYASQQYAWDSISVNHMTSSPYGSELHCKFVSISKDILIRAYNVRISYLHVNIIIKSCFHQIKHHPDIVRALSYVLAEYLFFQVGLAFSTGFSPANGWQSGRSNLP